MDSLHLFLSAVEVYELFLVSHTKCTEDRKNTPQSRDLHQGQINCYIHNEHFAMWISQSLQSNSIAERTVSKINNALHGAGINVNSKSCHQVTGYAHWQKKKSYTLC